MTTTIEWTTTIQSDGTRTLGRSWNPVTGCDPISPGCDHCYAQTFAERWRGTPGHHYEQGFDLRLWHERLSLPLTWKRPCKVFVNSMSDWCQEGIPDSFILDMFRTMLTASHHTYFLLTKRAPRMLQLEPQLTSLIVEMTGSSQWPSQIGLGVTVEGHPQQGRISLLRKMPAAWKYISYEPAIAPLARFDRPLLLEGIDWLICGAESGVPASSPAFRPLPVDWVRDVRDLCQLQDVAFFYKQQVDARGHKISLPPLDGKVWDEMLMRCHCCDRVVRPWLGSWVETYWLCELCLK